MTRQNFFVRLTIPRLRIRLTVLAAKVTDTLYSCPRLFDVPPTRNLPLFLCLL